MDAFFYSTCLLITMNYWIFAYINTLLGIHSRVTWYHVLKHKSDTRLFSTKSGHILAYVRPSMLDNVNVGVVSNKALLEKTEILCNVQIF